MAGKMVCFPVFVHNLTCTGQIPEHSLKDSNATFRGVWGWKQNVLGTLTAL